LKGAAPQPRGNTLISYTLTPPFSNREESFQTPSGDFYNRHRDVLRALVLVRTVFRPAYRFPAVISQNGCGMDLRHEIGS